MQLFYDLSRIRIFLQIKSLFFLEKIYNFGRLNQQILFFIFLLSNSKIKLENFFLINFIIFQFHEFGNYRLLSVQKNQSTLRN